MVTVLEVTIAVTFVFLLLSLLVSAFTEIIASYTRWRAGHLWKALRGMIGQNSVSVLLAQPLVKALNVPMIGSGLSQVKLGPKHEGPSYLPAETFATAILDHVLQPHRTLEDAIRELRITEALTKNLANPAAISLILTNVASKLPATGPLSHIQTELNQWSADVVAGKMTIQDVASQLEKMCASAGAFVTPDWVGAVQTLPGTDEALRKTLQTLARKAGDDIERFRTEIENWFNDMMERVSGWYKRKTQAVQFFAALALALWLDIDTVRLLQVLWVDSALRASVVAEAEAFARNPPPELLPSAAVTSPQDEPKLRYATWQSKIQKLKLPIGWCPAGRESITPSDPAGWWCEDEQPRQLLWVFRIPDRPYFFVGWLLTALAASFGAPFWFDLLKRFVSIRSSGRAPEERPTPPKEVPPAK
jgi:hypothetical protein